VTERTGTAGEDDAFVPRPASGRLSSRLRHLAGAAGILMLGFVASRVLGLVRNAVLASYFGASREYEAYVAAIAVPDTVFQVLAGGAMGAAFIPVFAHYLARDEQQEAWRLSSSVITIAALLTGTLSLVLFVFARPVMDVVVSGRDEAFKELATGLVRIMLISPAVFAVSGFLTSVLNTYQRFFWAALAPLMYNAGIIAGAVLLHDRLGIYGVAWGVAAGALGHLLIQVPGLLQIGARYRPLVDWRHAGVREVGRLVVPRMFGLGVSQVNLLVTTIFLASWLAVGSMAYLNYAWLVMMVPLGVFGMAVSTAVFPTLARQSAADEQGEMRELFALTLRMILFLTVPATVGLVVIGEPIVRLLFERDSFTPAVTRATALALTYYALGLPAHSVVEIVNRAFYALHDTATPVKAAAIGVLLNVALSAAVVLDAAGGVIPRQYAYVGLAVANAVAAWVEATLLVWWLRRRLGGLGPGGPGSRALGVAVLRFAAAALLMGSALALLDDPLWRLLDPTRFGDQLLGVSALILAGMAAYLGGTLFLRSREPHLLLDLLRR
jgi:putative peptidoglycan lipid II flippase